ncbi:uncharacterized protein [Dermacentor andersoni]|uniref:uncharacterized protein n=1 Tax=Dermacentor andersoni TaxID=34620 RepID=UPI002155EA06|nr:uncharacterized protein LOC126540108 [Dermacentor andersoni]
MASESARLQHLLASKGLGDRRPSELLNSMRHLLGTNNVYSNSVAFRELFMQRLPQFPCLVLVAVGDLTLDRSSHLADGVHDLRSPPSLPTPEYSVISPLESRIDQLAVSIDALRTSSHDQCDYSSRLGRRSSSPSSPRRSPIRWYYRTFQHRARQCKSPCSWSGKAP